jgi:cytochrome c-type biogenesis protein CcmH/NrfG
MRVFIPLILLFPAVGCGPPAGDRLAEARRLFEEGRPAEARAIVDDLAGSPPGGAADLAELAGLFTDLAAPDRALAVIGERAEGAVAEPALVDAAAEAALRAGDRPRAKRLLDGLSGRGAATADTHRLLGMVAFADNRLSDARRAVVEARRLRPDDPRTEAVFGWLLFSEGKPAEAVSVLRASCLARPKAPEPAAALSQVLLATSPSDPSVLREAADLLERVAAVRPMDRTTRRNLGVVLNRLGRHVPAEAVFLALTEQEPDRAEGFTGLGVARMGRGKVEAAVEAFRKAEELAPRDLGVLMNLGNGLLEFARATTDREKTARAAGEVFERARRLAPREPDVYVGLGRAALKANPANDARAAEAMDFYRQALALDPEHFEANLNIALLYYDLWNFDKAPEGEGFLRAREHFTRAAAKVPPDRWDPMARQAFEEIRER